MLNEIASLWTGVIPDLSKTMEENIFYINTSVSETEPFGETDKPKSKSYIFMYLSILSLDISFEY